MKIIRLPLFLTIIFFLNIGNTKDNMSIYDFSFQDIDGNKVKLEKFNGKPILLVNTASKCGFTPQYGDLQNLFKIYEKTDLIFIATPSNDFKQELSDEEEIKKYCLINYGVSFNVTEIINLKGYNAHPLYKWIKDEYKQQPKWNFYKYLFNRDGDLVESWSSITKPTSLRIKKSIEKLL